MDLYFNVLHHDLYDYWSNTKEWEKKFLAPGLVSKEWDLIVDEEMDGVFTYPFFTKEFCEKMIEQSEFSNKWQTKRHTSYPAVDFKLTEINFEKIYYDLLQKYVMSLLIHKFELLGTGWDSMNSENFLTRYTPDTQGHLSLHHDNSQLTALVNLSKDNVDYTGGGTWFVRQKKLLKPEQGWMSVHPGNITHKHGARPVLTGKRYVMVSFMKNLKYA